MSKKLTPETYPCLYLSGSMSGRAQHNRPVFALIARALRDLGYIVINPGELGGAPGDFNYYTQLGRDLQELAAADAVALIPTGGDPSLGVAVELAAATHLDKPVHTWDQYMCPRVEPGMETYWQNINHKREEA